MALDQHSILLKMVVMVSQHHLTGRPCWSWLSWFIGVSTRRWAFAPELEHGVVAEMLGVIGVCIPRGDLINALGQQVPQGMVNIGWVPCIVDSGCEAFRQANLTVDTTQQEGTKI
jgi:hypothetical protein